MGKIYYHEDPDGRCCAAIVSYATHISLGDMRAVNYGKPFPIKDVQDNELVYIVDFFPEDRNIFDELCKKTTNIVWIDHHKSHIDNNNDITYIQGLREIGTAACVLTWKYFYSNKPIPAVVQFIGDYDLWNFTKKNTESFVEGLKGSERPIEDIMCMLSEDCNAEYLIEEFIDNGSSVIKYRDHSNLELVKKIGFVAELDGYIVLACNYLGNSVVFKNAEKAGIDFVSTFNYDGSIFTVSMYNISDKSRIDLSELAKSYGGGGHFSAAGFPCANLPYKYLMSYKEWMRK